MEQELWYRLREQQRSTESVPRCEPAETAPHPHHRIEQWRRIVGRAMVRVAELIAAERYVPQTR
jgi:hypothetical protein